MRLRHSLPSALGLALVLVSQSAWCVDAEHQNVSGSSESVASVPASAPTEQRPPPTEDGPSVADAAKTHGLPEAFFRRLIWQESRFNPRAVSRAGAQGIAQFMPGTARWRRLDDPFDTASALSASARWLRELWGEFGNLGLAAAAYNAGPQRVRNWLKGEGNLPAETRAYVTTITGQSAAYWAGCSREPTPSCGELPKIALHEPAQAKIESSGKNHNWGLQLIGDPSQEKALASFRNLQARFGQVLAGRKPHVIARRLPGRGTATWYQVRVAEATRVDADKLCSRLKQAGGACVVLRN